MKPQELADRSGVSKASISQYLSGSHAPSNISSGKMGKILRVEPMWLMGFDVSKKKEPTPDMAKEDFKLFEKFSLLDNRDKETILSMTDVMLSRKEKSED
jgi:transcriptional regulator with XRE-family HTH domain